MNESVRHGNEYTVSIYRLDFVYEWGLGSNFDYNLFETLI